MRRCQQTGSGKTHTMVGGGGASAGVIPRALHTLFQRLVVMQAEGWTTSVTCQVLEIYNDDVFDLAPDASGTARAAALLWSPPSPPPSP
jgi:kinesin family protein C1